MPSINFGTLSLTNGSKIVTGTNTFFSDNLVDGSVIVIDQMVYLIDTVDSQTQVTLTLPWPGTTGTGIEYEAYLTSDYSKATFSKVVELIDTFGPLRVSAEAFEDLINSRADDAEAAAAAAAASAADADADRIAAQTAKTASEAARDTTLGYKSDVLTLKGDVLTLKSDVTTLKSDTNTLKVAAETARTGAETAQSLAEAARDATFASLDSFDDRYLGAKTSNPTLDNDGNALVAGAIYFKTSAPAEMRVYNGTSWVAAYADGATLVSKAGDTMTGLLTLSGAPTADLHASTKKYVDDGLALKLSLSGGSLTGALAGTSATFSGTVAVGGTASLANGAVFQVSGGNQYSLKANTNDLVLRSVTAALDIATFQYGGNMGIGTTSPSAKLHVKDGSIFNQNSAGTPYFFFGNADGSANLKYSYMGGGSGGYITFGKASDALAPTAEWARFDGSGNFGIGTASPSYKLDVAADARVMGNLYVQPSTTTANALTRYVNTGGTAYVGLDNSSGGLGGPYALNLWHSGAYPIVFGTNNTEKMRLDSTGNLGIGTSAPKAALHAAGGTLAVVSPVLGAATNSAFIVSNTAAAYGLNVVPSGDGSVHLQAQRFDGATNTYPILLNSKGGDIGLCGTGTVAISGYNTVTLNGASNGCVFDMTQGGGMKLRFVASTVAGAIETASAIPLIFLPGGSEVVRVTTNGLAGFGTTNPLTRIHGSVGSSGNTSDVLTLENTGTGANTQARMNFRASNSLYGTIAAGQGASAPEMVFNISAGNYKWQQSGANVMLLNSAGELLVGKTTTSISTFGTVISTGNINLTVSAAGGYAMGFYNAGGGSAVGSIQTGASSTLYNTSSDERLKKNIQDADADTGSIIDAIRIRKFDWKATNQHERLGVIAQELIKVAPEAVGGDPEDEDHMMGVDYSKLVPMLIKEIQSLRGRVAGLEDDL